MAQHLSTDQISFYDESLKKQIHGSYTSDGRAIHVRSVYGAKSAPYSQVGGHIDGEALNLLAQKVLSELARDPDSNFKDLQQQKGDQQLRPTESYSCSGIRG